MRERAQELGRKCGYPDITNRDQSAAVARAAGLVPEHSIRCVRAALLLRLQAVLTLGVTEVAGW